LRKRKLPASFDYNSIDELEMSESEPEDDIRIFRRVHLKARKAQNVVQWSATNKHPYLTVDSTGLEVSLAKDIDGQ